MLKVEPGKKVGSYHAGGRRYSLRPTPSQAIKSISAHLGRLALADFNTTLNLSQGGKEGSDVPLVFKACGILSHQSISMRTKCKRYLTKQ